MKRTWSILYVEHLMGTGKQLFEAARRMDLGGIVAKHRLLLFAGLRFHGLGCGKFPISVWLGAQGTGIQLTPFLGRCTTSRTRHG